MGLNAEKMVSEPNLAELASVASTAVKQVTTTSTLHATTSITMMATTTLDATTATTTTVFLTDGATGNFTIVAQGVSAHDVYEVVQSMLAKHFGMQDVTRIQVVISQSRRLQQSLLKESSSTVVADHLVWWRVSYTVRVPPEEVAAIGPSVEKLLANRLTFAEDLGVLLSARAKEFSLFSKSFSLSGFAASALTY